MTKKIVIFIFLLIAVPVLLFLLAGKKEKQITPAPVQTQPIAPTIKKTNAQTTLTFSPNPYNISSPSGSLNLQISTGENNVTGVQLELSYNPQVVTSIDVKPGDFFDNPLEFLKKIDMQAGKITYVLAIPPTAQPKKGAGTVVTVQFTTALQPGQKTDLTILPKTIVTAEKEDQSVLKEASNATILR